MTQAQALRLYVASKYEEKVLSVSFFLLQNMSFLVHSTISHIFTLFHMRRWSANCLEFFPENFSFLVLHTFSIVKRQQKKTWSMATFL